MTAETRNALEDAARLARALGAGLVLSFGLLAPAHAQSDGGDGEDPAVTEPEEPVRPDVYYRADGSLLVRESLGLNTINQEAGDGVDQGNVISLSFTVRDAAIAEATAFTRSVLPEGADFQAIRSVRFADAALGAQGVVMVNQSVGVGSGQLNVLSLASTQSGPAIAFASAVQENETRYFGDAFGGGATLSGVGRGMSGLFAINQDVGLDGSQANVIAAATTEDGNATAVALLGEELLRRFPEPDPEEPPLEDGAGADAGEGETGGEPQDPGPVEIVEITDTGAPEEGAEGEEGEAAEEEEQPLPVARLTIADSFVGASGVAQVNQGAGAGNAQGNLLSIAFGTGTSSATALADQDLADVGAAPETDTRQPLDARFDGAGSFEGFTGVGQVNRVAGYDNQVVNAIAITVVRVGGAP